MYDAHDHDHDRERVWKACRMERWMGYVGEQVIVGRERYVHVLDLVCRKPGQQRVIDAALVVACSPSGNDLPSDLSS